MIVAPAVRKRAVLVHDLLFLQISLRSCTRSASLQVAQIFSIQRWWYRLFKFLQFQRNLPTMLRSRLWTEHLQNVFAEILDHWLRISAAHLLLKFCGCRLLLPRIQVSAFAHDQPCTFVNRAIKGEEIRINNVAYPFLILRAHQKLLRKPVHFRTEYSSHGLPARQKLEPALVRRA